MNSADKPATPAARILLAIRDSQVLSEVMRRLPSLPGFLPCQAGSDCIPFGEPPPELALLDVTSDHAATTIRVAQLTRHWPGIRVLVIGPEPGAADFVVPWLCFGLRGFLPVESPPARYAAAIEAVMRGEFWLSRSAASSLLLSLVANRAEEAPPVNGLVFQNGAHFTPREQEIALLVASGYGNKEIARELGVCPSTIKTSLRRMFGKLRIRRRSELARYAAESHLTALSDTSDANAKEDGASLFTDGGTGDAGGGH